MNDVTLYQVVAVFMGFLIALWIYFIPYTVGHSRGVAHTTLLFWANFLFAGTVLAWFILLAYACIAESRKEREKREWRADAQDRILAAQFMPPPRMGFGHGRIDPPPLRRV